MNLLNGELKFHAESPFEREISGYRVKYVKLRSDSEICISDFMQMKSILLAQK